MIKQQMEIKVALLGNVSAGKTTVLNAILQNKYGEVAKKRTTAGANYFYLHVAKDDAVVHNSTENQNPVVIADSIHEEITEDNRKKVRDGHGILKKEFDIELPEAIVRCRNDTVLVLIDIPGINEAGTENKYKEFVSENWTTFDCVIVVMDGKQGVNTEDQVFLLTFVKEHQEKKDVPVIILCNKVDDPLDFEQEELVHEARKEVQKIFNVQCREESLRSVLEKYDQKQQFKGNMSPAFIPISAGNAFIYRCGSQMTLEKFQSFDRAIIDSFGRDQLGQKAWNKLSIEKRIEKVFTLVSDNENYIEGIKECNFATFMNVLDMFVGGEDRQKFLIKKQVELSLSSVQSEPFKPGKITKAIRDAFTNLTGLGALESFGGIKILQNYFWTAHKSFEDTSFQKFQDSWPKALNVNLLAGPMKELCFYYTLVLELKWENEEQEIASTAELWVHTYFEYLLLRNSTMDQEEFVGLSDSKITTVDWFLIFDSMLSCNQEVWEMWFSDIRAEFRLRSQIASKMMIEMSFCGRVCKKCKRSVSECANSSGFVCHPCSLAYVKTMPEHCIIHGQQYTSFDDSAKHFSCCRFTYCLYVGLSSLKRKYDEHSVLVPYVPNVYNTWVHVKIPSSLNDPTHFGYLPSQFCLLMNEMSEREKEDESDCTKL